VVSRRCSWVHCAWKPSFPWLRNYRSGIIPAHRWPRCDRPRKSALQAVWLSLQDLAVIAGRGVKGRCAHRRRGHLWRVCGHAPRKANAPALAGVPIDEWADIDPAWRGWLFERQRMRSSATQSGMLRRATQRPMHHALGVLLEMQGLYGDCRKRCKGAGAAASKHTVCRTPCTMCEKQVPGVESWGRDGRVLGLNISSRGAGLGESREGTDRVLGLQNES
jgi:hypothetical protein